MFKSIMKAAAAVVDVPVALVADVVTCGGMTTDQGETYTGRAAKRFVKNVEDMTGPDQ